MASFFKSILPYIKDQWIAYFAGFFFLILANSGQLLMPYWLRQAVDHFAQKQQDTGFIAHLLVFMAITAVVIALSRMGWRYFIIRPASKIEYLIRQKLMDHLLLLSPSFYAQRKIGDLMARATNDLEAVRMSVGIAFVAFIDAIFITTSIVIILFLQYSSLALIVISPLTLITLLILCFGGLVGKQFKRVQESYSNISQFVQEHLTGNGVVKAFVLEHASEKEFHQVNQEYLEVSIALAKLWGVFFPIITALSGLSSLFLLLFGGISFIEGRITAGEFTATLAYLGMLIWPLIGAGMVVNWLQRGATSFKRINEVLTTPPTICSPQIHAIKHPQHYGISIKNLTFRYQDEGQPVLNQLSFDIPEGTFLGILGKLGSGKSTLTWLLPRLWDPPPSTIFLGDQDIRDFDLDSLRRFFSLVPQTTFLFSDTIRNNLAFASPEAEEDFLKHMAELSTINRDISTFDKGLETMIGEKGVTLSGGQKQRLALSRALAAERPILILDDALSSVDVETEKKILSHLLEVRSGLTNILISHRISTLQNCSTIIVLDEGRLVQSGTHEELLSQEGIYQEIARIQHL